MEGQRSGFLQKLRYEDGNASQRKVAEEAIERQLFVTINDLKLENGDVIDINEMTNLIANKLGIQQYKSQIRQYITELIQNGSYQVIIDDNGNIKANYSRLYIMRKIEEQRNREEANKILQGFVQKVEEYASYLEHKNIKVTERTLQSKFSEEELKMNGNWIDIAIFAVMENRNKEK